MCPHQLSFNVQQPAGVVWQERNSFYIITVHSKVCTVLFKQLGDDLWNETLLLRHFYLFWVYNLSSMRQMLFSSITFKRKQTSVQVISPKLGNSHQKQPRWINSPAGQRINLHIRFWYELSLFYDFTFKIQTNLASPPSFKYL